MELEVRYFGLVKERTSIDKEAFNVDPSETVTGLIMILRQKYPSISGINYQVALNNKLVESEVVIPEGSEVSLMPPFAGG